MSIPRAELPHPLNCWQQMTPFTLYTVLLYLWMNFGLLLYLKLTRVDVGNTVKKVKNVEGIITWSIFASWFLSIMSPISHMKHT